MDKIFLVPGFFGFTRLGSLSYFHGVADFLNSHFAKTGFKAQIIECQTKPTGSIKRRAECVLDEVIKQGFSDEDRLHFVGHSTGGLDIRLLLTPNVRIRDGEIEEKIGRLTKNIITVSTPHFGTPLANYFTTLPGRQLLQIITIMATTKSGRYGLFAGSKILSFIARLDDWAGRTDTFLDRLSEKFLSKITTGDNDELFRFLDEVSRDQGAVIQLTPEGMNLYNAAVSDRENCNYFSIVTAAPPPPTNFRLDEINSAAKLSMAGLFTLMYTIASREHPHYPYPSRADEYKKQLEDQLPFPLTAHSNDGVVPSLSQVYGENPKIVVSDHLDIVGQYPWAGGDPYADWLPSGSGFDTARFEYVWSIIANRISEST
ncbi:hypothetical protein KKF34_07970 [Myxococcota bacterium]|nr:hypothetical protein [Myxococcota bacterium]MBU1379395.1 hypothetical protein [Myxococcota bacterium]MBU1496797.1 hypothetical protein [Myxococcota bacterium]